MKRHRIIEIIGIFVGALLLLLSPLLIFYGRRIGVIGFETIFSAAFVQDASVDTSLKALSHHIDTVIYCASAGAAGFLLGIIILTWSILAFRRAGRAVGDIPSA